MNNEQNTMISKFLSLVLRHSPEKLGITLDKHGYADIETLIREMNKRGLSVDKKTIDEIVYSDNKERYGYNDTKTKIRANQGHSIKVDLNLTPKTPPRILYHGTAKRFMGDILKKGISKMDRQYVHLSQTKETAIEVGKRHGTPVVISVDTKEMIKDGYVFYLSENNVWLTDFVPAKYLIL